MYPPYSTLSPSAPVNTVQSAAPATGETVSPSVDVNFLIITTGPLVALTVNLPETPQRGNGSEFVIVATSAITTLTLASVSTILGGVTTLAANGFARFVYNSGTWYRCG